MYVWYNIGWQCNAFSGTTCHREVCEKIMLIMLSVVIVDATFKLFVNAAIVVVIIVLNINITQMHIYIYSYLHLYIHTCRV